MEVKQAKEFDVKETSAEHGIENQVANESLSYIFSKLDVEEKIKDIVKPKADFEIIQRSSLYEEKDILDTGGSSDTKKNTRSKRRSRSSISEEDDATVFSECLKGKDVRYTPYSMDRTSVSQGKSKTVSSDASSLANANLIQLISSLSPSKQSFVQAAEGDVLERSSFVPVEFLLKSSKEQDVSKGENTKGAQNLNVKEDAQSTRKRKDNMKVRKGNTTSKPGRTETSGGSYSKLLESMGRSSSGQARYKPQTDGMHDVWKKNEPDQSVPPAAQNPSLPVSYLESQQTSHKKKDGGRQPVMCRTHTEEGNQFPETTQRIQSAKGKADMAQQKQHRQPLARDQYGGCLQGTEKSLNDPRLAGKREQYPKQGDISDNQYKPHYQGQKYGGQKYNIHGQGNGQQTSRTSGNQGQGQIQNRQKSLAPKQKQVFEPYWPVDAVSDGLKRKELIQSQVRINAKNFNEAYVPLPDGTADLFICGLNNRNRALNGDIVAVQILNRDQWRVFKEDLDFYKAEAKDSDQMDKKVEMTREAANEETSNQDVIIESEEEIEMDEHGVVIKSVKKKVKDGEVLIQQMKSVAIKQEGEHITSSPSRSSSEKSYQGKDVGKAAKVTPQKKYTSLGEVLANESSAVKQLFADKTDSSATVNKQVIGNKFLQMTGKVVYIIERKHSRACTGFLKPMQDGNRDRVFFSPLDHRLPRIIIPVSDCPKGFIQRPGDHATTLFVARIVEWKEQSVYAEGCLAKSLGEAGQIEPETEGILIENGVAFEEFPQEAIENLPKETPWKIPTTEFEYRRDFRSQCVFTIDPTTARDLDDALSCEDIGGGEYEIGVHIADVSFFLKENCLLDNIASNRATSVYLVQKVIPMLPRILCEQLCSLNPAEERLTFSVVWKMNKFGEISEEWFGRSVIKSCVKLGYDHAQEFIEQPDREWSSDELPPICGSFSIQDIKSRVLLLHQIAQHLRKARFKSGALRLDQVKLQYSLDSESGLPNGYFVYTQRDSNKLVEEFMLLANMAVAHKIKAMFPEIALLRRHPEPQSKMTDDLKSLLKDLGVNIDVSSAGSMQKSLQSCYGDDDYSKARMQVLTTLCSKPMQTAKYFCTGCIDDEELYHHYALNVPLYTHFTSPIRRYADVIVHRMLASSLEYCAVTSQSKMDIQKQASHCNDKKTASKRVQDLSSELFFAIFVKEAGPLEERGMVMGVFDKAFDVYILKLGVSKRVYCDQLPLRDKSFIKNHKQPILTLYWLKDDEHHSEVEQEITIFSLVKCVLQADKDPLKWQATIKHPD